MALVLDDGNALCFGEEMEKVEHLFSCHAIDNPSPIARKAVDKIIKTANLQLDFDSGRLCRVTFADEYQFIRPPTPYPEVWKNFPVIGARKIYRRMPREEFLSYVSAWEQRAIGLGAEKIAFDDLTGKQFSVSIDRDSPWYDAVNISMGPSRRAGGGGIWCDGWNAIFTRRDPNGGISFVTLERLSVFRDEFNSVARR
jgi:hypothetical protein